MYLVEHLLLEELRVAKIVSNREADSERILHEAKLIKSLKHPGIPTIYDILTDKDSICIIEEYISGKSLPDYLKDQNIIDLRLVCDIGIKICDILEYMHHTGEVGILHLDLKPEHIIISDDQHVSLIDFDHSHDRKTLSEDYYGSVGYAAPEQYHRLRLDCSADIYSLGMLLLYMSCYGHDLSSLEHIRHKELFPIISKCIKHSSILRYRSVNCVNHALKKILKQFEHNENNTTHNIYIYGIRQGVGTTHLALCLTAFLQQNGFSVICMEKDNPEDLRYEIQNGRLTEHGYYKVNGINLLPDYQNRVEVIPGQFDYRIYDCGVYQNHLRLDENEPTQNRVVVIVGQIGHRCRTILEEYEELDLEADCFLNHMSGTDYYHMIRQCKSIRKYYRMPCVYSWSTRNHLMDQILDSFLQDHFEEYKRESKWKRWIQSYRNSGHSLRCIGTYGRRIGNPKEKNT